MEQMQDHMNGISRKKFLRVCGSVVAGGTIAGVTGNLLWKMFTRPDEVFFGVGRGSDGIGRPVGGSFLSPYKLVSSFKAPGQIDAFELYGERLVVAVSNRMYVYAFSGELVNSFPVESTVRDVVADGGCIYVLYPARIAVYDLSGEWLRGWEACSEESDYCSFTVLAGSVFVTDAANKIICKYTAAGQFVKFVRSPEGFIVPSYSFGITHAGGVVYCSNPGRHSVESYSPEGEYISSFGNPGVSPGSFGGCCNPVYLSATPTGEIITSEKGIPRISCYGREGDFHSVLLDEEALGGGHAAYRVRVWKDKLLITGKDRVSAFQYDKEQALQTACSGCRVACPLRSGVTIG